jgi:mRNA interferase RelE/StbE
LTWKIKWDARVEKDLKKIDQPFRKKITRYMEDRVATQSNPRVFDKGLLYEKFGLWRYRVKDYRIICRINDDDIEVLVIQVAHRKEVYDE